MIPLGTAPSVSYQLPANICARCGTEGPTTLKEVESTRSSNYLVIRTHRTVKFNVPLCAECLTSHDQAQRNSGTIGCIVFAIGAGLIAVSILQGDPIIDSLCGIGFVTVIIVGILMWIIGPKDFATFDGRVFAFRNPDFQARFAQLNPTLAHAPPTPPVPPQYSEPATRPRSKS